jgi:lipoate-protein ligase B
MASNVIRVVNLGRMDYLRTLRIQHQLADRLKADRQREQPASNVLILVEHPPVYTTGIRTKVPVSSLF